MPTHKCTRKGESGWQYGSQKCYIPSEEGSDEAARQKAIAQSAAIKATGYIEGFITQRTIKNMLADNIKEEDEYA